jgi:hypothetical protein
MGPASCLITPFHACNSCLMLLGDKALIWVSETSCLLTYILPHRCMLIHSVLACSTDSDLHMALPALLALAGRLRLVATCRSSGCLGKAYALHGYPEVFSTATQTQRRWRKAPRQHRIAKGQRQQVTQLCPCSAAHLVVEEAATSHPQSGSTCTSQHSPVA